MTDILEAGVMEVLQDGGYLDRAKGLISTVSTGTNSVLETVVAALVDTGGNKGTRSVQVLVLVMLVLLQVTTARLSLISWVNVLDSMSRLRTSSCSASSSLKSLSLSLIFSILFFSLSSLKEIFLPLALLGTASFSRGFGSVLMGVGLGDFLGVSGGLYLGSLSKVGSGVCVSASLISSGDITSVSESMSLPLLPPFVLELF